ncbi:RNase A-like domain-containing protein, partial [Dickeya sp. ws52]|uniref:RNase A-like domain-containing protein n=1 Tax=Dickeya sp. ws52 TaxID=2576377 RepID=UPI001237B2D4
RKASELNEEQRQLLSTLSTIAGGLAAGVVGNSGTDAVQGAQSAQVAVENNLLSAKRSQDRYEKLAACNGDKDCVAEVRREFGPESDEQRQRVETCSSAADCYTVEQGLKSMRAEYSQQEAALAEKARTQGVSSLSEAEQKEWIAARSALTELDSQINLSLHRAQTMGGSAEVSAEITNVMGHAAIASAAGVAGGISKATSKESVTTGQNSPIVPGGGLAAHEVAGGHLIDRHVGKTEAELLNRVSTGNVKTASSFTDRATAEAVTSRAIDSNQSKIRDYLSGSQKAYLEIDYQSSSPIGISVSRGVPSATQVTNARIVIARDPSMPTGYRIVTGYPTP